MEAVLASTASELTKDFFKGTLAKLSGGSKELFQRFFPQFEKHLASVYLRNSRVKILVNRDAPVPFSEIYIPSRFRSGSESLTDKSICDNVVNGKKLVVSAIGGAGKTFLLRHVWLSMFDQKSGKVPIFLELRKLNGAGKVPLDSFISASAFGTDFTEGNFQHFAEDGSFVFLLDGFDEVNREKRADLEAQIIALARKFPKCGMIVSGRPDDRFGGWQEFTAVRAMPFQYDQFRQLIEKIPFDPQIKSNFLRIANNSFFQQHESFLSNPLLSMMMLLTYRDNAEIPGKLSTFYENCFATLFSQHDALKESFRREKCLDQLEFKRVFSVFCLMTYKDSRPSLDRADFIEYVKRAKEYLRLPQDVPSIAHDFLESVNLMIQEGTNVSFIHRSFQEFFAAVCVTSVLHEGIPDMLRLFAGRMTDNSFRLAFETHPALVVKEFFVPKYRALSESKSLFRRRDGSRPYRACAAAGILVKFGVDFPEAKNGQTGRVRRLVTRLTLIIDPEIDAFLFACNEAFLKSSDYMDFRSKLFELFNCGFGIIAQPNKDQLEVLRGSEWQFSVSFVEGGVVIRSFTEDDSENAFPGDYSKVGMERLNKAALKLEGILSALTKKGCAGVEDAIALQEKNKFVFLRS
ncbi:MAG: NACHT domain-containing protein [Tabrizicola sp.]